MSKEITSLITQIARIRNVDVNYVCETLKLALLSGLKRRFGPNTQAEIEIDPEHGDLRVYLLKKVVLKPEDDSVEISREAAVARDPKARLGELLRIEIPLPEVGRVAIRRAGDELIVKLREAEGTKLYDEYSKKKGDVVTGTVSRLGRDEVTVNLGLVDAVLPNREQLKTDHYRQGMPVKAYIHRVDKTPIGPRIYLSRSHPEFLRKLLWREVPEIQEGVVEIKGIVRIPGFRAKVAVMSNDTKIDPVGACVGFKKARIQNVLKELSGEKIDIVQWAKETPVFISRALAPARVIEVIGEADSYTVVVPDAEFSIAIGKKGQNVWLASLLTQTKLDVLKESDYRNRQLMLKAAGVKLETVAAISDEMKEKLAAAGLATISDLLTQTVESFTKATGLDAIAFEDLKQKLRQALI